jgi:hypothetical protein
MSSKISAIYDALDSGNPKQALRLSTVLLAKKPDSLMVLSLQALAYARLGQREQAKANCVKVVDACPVDPTIIETIQYTLRREGLFDLQTKLVNNAVEAGKMVTPELLRDCFFGNLHSEQFAPLPNLAMRLWKQTGNKKFLGWYAFALSLNGDTGDEKYFALISNTLGKLVDRTVPNGTSRWTTSGRMELYLSLFKAQMLRTRGENEKAIAVIESVTSRLMTDDDKLRLVRDLKGEVEMERGDDSTVLGKIHNLIKSKDLIIEEQLISLLIEYITVSHSRSDLVVVVSPLIALLHTEQAVSTITDSIRAILEISSLSGQSIVNLNKLMYSMDVSKVDDFFLAQSAMNMCVHEPASDECSPSKQLLLLSAIVGLEKGGSGIDTLAVLDFGANKFTLCSHFRLVQCLVYGYFGMSCRAIERFESLGIKNAQWESLVWVIEGVMENLHVPTATRKKIADSVLRHQFHDKLDMRSSVELILDECMFWLYPKFKGVAVEGQTGEGGIFFPASPKCVCPDFSPMLFMALRKPGSESIENFAQAVHAQNLATPRCCGFQWEFPRFEMSGDPTTYIGDHRVLGRIIQENRNSAKQVSEMKTFCVNLIRGTCTNVPRYVHDHELYGFIVRAVDSVDDAIPCIVEKIKTVSSQCELAATQPLDLPNMATLFRSIGSILNGWVQMVLVVVDRLDDKKLAKRFRSEIVSSLIELRKSIKRLESELSSIHFPPTALVHPELIAHREKFQESLITDLKAELAAIQAGVAEIEH